jgi:uncharacterized protein (UPF0332 family)
MPVEPRDVYELGNAISTAYNTEAAKRSAVSRIYYSVFLSVRQRFPVSSRTRQVHMDVRAALAKATKRQTGDQFGDLMDLRNEADYDIHTDGWDSKLLRAKRLADHINAELFRRFGS